MRILAFARLVFDTTKLRTLGIIVKEQERCGCYVYVIVHGRIMRLYGSILLCGHTDLFCKTADRMAGRPLIMRFRLYIFTWRGLLRLARSTMMGKF